MPWRRTALALLALGALAAIHGFWVEPRLLLLSDEVELGLDLPPFRILHLSDLHIARETAIERRLIAAIRAERPDLIAISGDLVADTHDLERLVQHTLAAARVLTELRAIAPVVGVQGHSEYYGPVVAALGRSGLVWLSNEGRRAGSGNGFLLLGLNQQVGREAAFPGREPPFEPLSIDGEAAFGRDEHGWENAYDHYDPAPASLVAEGGPLAWTSYTLDCEIRIGEADAEAGVAVLSRYVLGEDRLLQIRRPAPEGAGPTSFSLVPHGTGMTAGQPDTFVVPEPRRWYRLKVTTEVDAAETRVRMKSWPADETEPASWQAWATDSTPERLTAGTVGLWARQGTAAFRRLEVTSADGTVLLAAPLTGGMAPAGFREGARATRLELALARSPARPAGVPAVVLAHTPGVVLDAAHLGLDAVLAGHTHGGQVRLPGRALVTRSSLGLHYDLGVFDFAAPTRRGWTRLYLNPGIGTSKLPVRFLCPPRYAVVEVGRER